MCILHTLQQQKERSEIHKMSNDVINLTFVLCRIILISLVNKIKSNLWSVLQKKTFEAGQYKPE